MKIQLERFHPGLAKDWDGFVATSKNGNLFHYRKFLNYHIVREFIDYSLLFYDGGRLVALFPAAEKFEGSRRILHSHPGASFGGIVHGDISFSHMQQILEKLEIFAQNEGFDTANIILPLQIYHRSPDELCEYLLHHRAWKMSEFYISSVISLDAAIEKILQNISRRKNRSRNYYDKLFRREGLHFEWQNDFDAFYPILLENKSRHQSHPTHSLSELKKLDQLFPGCLQLLLLKKGDCVIGGTLLFRANAQVQIIFYNMIDYKFTALQPAVLQLRECIRHASAEGFRYLDFGVSQLPQSGDPLAPSPNLIRFKEEFGAVAQIRRVFSKEFGNKNSDGS